MSYVANQERELNKKIEDAEQASQNAMKSGDIKTAVEKLAESAQYKEDIKAWQTGGDKKQMATAIATALSLTVAGRPTKAIAVGTASPYVNEVIKDITNNPNLKGLNIPLHALWGAVEAHLSGGNATTGAIAGGGGEALALLLTEKAYGKKPSDLTEAEKQELINVVKGVTGLVSAVTTKGNLAESLAAASTGMKVAESAVENNTLSQARNVIIPTMRFVCEKECRNTLGLGLVYALSNDEIKETMLIGAVGDPSQIAKLTDEQRQYLNSQILSGKNFILGNQVWIPNADGGFTEVDPELVTTNYGGKTVIDPRIFVNHKGEIEYSDETKITSLDNPIININIPTKMDKKLSLDEINNIDNDKKIIKGEKGKTFRGGSKKDRDKWYGFDNKDFQNWWDRKGKKEFGGNDIDNSKEAQKAWDYWNRQGRPNVK